MPGVHWEPRSFEDVRGIGYRLLWPRAASGDVTLEHPGHCSEATSALRYLILPAPISGRGGAVRFFLLANKIPFKEKLHALSDWPGVKASESF